MAHNVKLTEAIQRFIAESQSAFFEGLIEGLQSALSELQTVDREPVLAPMVYPKQPTGFEIEVAVVCESLDSFVKLREMLVGKYLSGGVFWCKRYKFTFVNQLCDNYYEFDKVLYADTTLDPLLVQITDKIVNRKDGAQMMTPMELIQIYNQPL